MPLWNRFIVPMELSKLRSCSSKDERDRGFLHLAKAMSAAE